MVALFQSETAGLKISLQETIQTIRSINSVQLVVELTNEKIRNKEHLVF